MAESVPVAIGMAGIGAALVVSGLQDRTISEILKGEYTHKEGGSNESTVSAPNEQGSSSGVSAPSPFTIKLPKKTAAENRAAENLFALLQAKSGVR